MKAQKEVWVCICGKVCSNFNNYLRHVTSANRTKKHRISKTEHESIIAERSKQMFNLKELQAKEMSK